jgi:hypothetical protein
LKIFSGLFTAPFGQMLLFFFLQNVYFVGASFETSSRKFGHPATVENKDTNTFPTPTQGGHQYYVKKKQV